MAAAVSAGKVSALATRLLGRGGGTALPGLVAQKVYPGVLRAITAQLPGGSLMVSGTNGKTTTARMIGSILDAAGLTPLHNRSGSNLERGLISTVVGAAKPGGRLPNSYRSGLFEVDEAAMPAVLGAVRPRVLLLNNLFRDQLDRYGELDAIYSKWRAALPRLSPESTLVLNADDPAIAALSTTRGLRAKLVTFGIEDEHYTLGELPHAADSISCPRCNSRLQYGAILLSHLGHWRCTNCGLSRPRPDVAATRVVLNGTESSLVQVSTHAGEVDIKLQVPGLYNVYNALAAVAATLAFGVSVEHIKAGLESFSAAFGRIERITIPGDGGRNMLMALVKNPVGFNEVLRMLFPVDDAEVGSPRNLLIIINDLIADGRDVSWLWDVDFEVLVTSQHPLGNLHVAGIRAADMANRLKYAGVDTALITCDTSLDGALDAAVGALPAGQTLYVLPTYTAMLAFRKLLHNRGWVQSQFWED
ncbi:MAG: MurT ligase domain-containing protein [Chloroflexota bacterium]